jgi:hypothetical protein
VATAPPTLGPKISTAVAVQDLSVLTGPGDEYLRLDTIPSGTRLVLTGRDRSGTWIRGRVEGQGPEGWFSAAAVQIDGDVMTLPVVDSSLIDQLPARIITSLPLPRVFADIPMPLIVIGLAILATILTLTLVIRALKRRPRTVRVTSTESLRVAGFNFEPKVVNTSASNQAITFTIHITSRRGSVGEPTDNGVVYGNFVRFSSPSGSEEAYVSFTGRNRLSGNGRDGVYVSTMTLPRHSEAGVWKLGYLEIQDNVGNSRTMSRDEMIERGFPTEFRVESASPINAENQPANLSMQEHVDHH